jgi:CDP-diacylglycerol--serine O-phosphatidyltransferase
MNEAKRLAYFLPNTFTALNLSCGFVSMLFVTQNRLKDACMLLLLGSLFDLVDGRVARLTGTQSSFGEQFDSISDVVSFGVAPAFIFYHHFLHNLGRPGIILAMLFLLCGALRLARFNANIDKISSNYFQGLPIPVGAVGTIGIVLASLELPILMKFKAIPITFFILYSLLMISNIPFSSFKNPSLVKKYKKIIFLIILSALGLIFLYEELMVAALISLYVLGSLIYFVINFKNFKDVFKLSTDDKDDS